MTQREAGDRLAAAPGSKLYGHVSVMVAYFGEARVVVSGVAASLLSHPQRGFGARSHRSNATGPCRGP